MLDLQPLLSFSLFISVFPPVTKPSVLQKAFDLTRAGELCLNPSKCPLTSHALAEAFTGQRPTSSNSVSPALFLFCRSLNRHTQPSLRPSGFVWICLDYLQRHQLGLAWISFHAITHKICDTVNAQKGIWRDEDGRQRRGIIDLPQTSEEQRSIFSSFSERKVIFCQFCKDRRLCYGLLPVSLRWEQA